MADHHQGTPSEGTPNTFDLIVIGGGPGGYVAAIKAAHLGFKVAVVDERDALGGTCLNVGCIPSKALLHASHLYDQTRHGLSQYGVRVSAVGLDLGAMMAQKNGVVGDLTRGIQGLFRKNGITFLRGTASFYGPHQIGVQDSSGTQAFYTARHFIIATGSESANVPGVVVDEEVIVSSTGALSFDRVPQNLVVIGGGYIGLEMASIWARLGAQVMVVEFADRLVPQMDHDMAAALEKALTGQGIAFRKGTKVQGAVRDGSKVRVTIDDVKTGAREEGVVDRVLVAIGRRPRTLGLNLDKAGVTVTDGGFILVNGQLQTSVPHIYAIGDVIGGAMLAHKAEDEGIAAAETIAGRHGHVNYKAIPSVIYTQPEAASVGLSEQGAIDRSIPHKVGSFPFLANSRAKAVGDTEGFVKIIAHQQTDEILGVHIFHSQAGTMIAEAALALEYRASCEDLARTCHAHPSFSEAVKEAALAAYERAIHF